MQPVPQQAGQPQGAAGGSRETSIQPERRGGTPPAQQAGGMATGRPGAQPRLQPVTVEEIVQTDVVTAERDTPVATVAAEMAEKEVGSVIIVEDGTPIKVVTDRSIALALEDEPDISEKEVDELIDDEDVITASAEMSVFKATQRMREAGIRRLPIVDEDGSLEGIVTLDDILVLLGAELTNATDIIQQQSPRM